MALPSLQSHTTMPFEAEIVSIHVINITQDNKIPQMIMKMNENNVTKLQRQQAN